MSLFAVTFIGQQGEATLHIEAANKELARRRLHEIDPTAHIVHVQVVIDEDVLISLPAHMSAAGWSLAEASVEDDAEKEDPWDKRAIEALEEALARACSEDIEGALAEATLAIDVMRVAMGEASPELIEDLEDVYRARDEGPTCICPPELVARGGFKGSCPAEHLWEESDG